MRIASARLQDDSPDNPLSRGSQAIFVGVQAGTAGTTGRHDGEAIAILELVNACERRWQPARVDIWYNLDLQGIAVVTPSVTRILIGATTEIARKLKKPVVLTNVQRFASESLETEAWHVKSPPFWIVDEDGEAHVVGRISRSLLRILAVMDELETACALSIASANSQSAPSKKEVGNVSVYLNHLFNAGLVGREKCNAVHRDNAERGWTYTYRSGSSLALRSLMSH